MREGSRHSADAVHIPQGPDVMTPDEHGLVLPMKRKVLEYNELQGIAEFRFHYRAKKQWPEWNIEDEDIPEDFEGTHDCPECTRCYLVLGYHPKEKVRQSP